MPAFGDRLTDQEIEAIVDFLNTRWGSEEREDQRQVTDLDEAQQDVLDGGESANLGTNDSVTGWHPSQNRREVMHMWMNWNAMSFLGWTMMILFWATLVLVIVWVVRSLSTGRSETAPTPLELLERRLAAGEIDPQEFEERKRLLSGR